MHELPYIELGDPTMPDHVDEAEYNTIPSCSVMRHAATNQSNFISSLHFRLHFNQSVLSIISWIHRFNKCDPWLLLKESPALHACPQALMHVAQRPGSWKTQYTKLGSGCSDCGEIDRAEQVEIRDHGLPSSTPPNMSLTSQVTVPGTVP